MRYINVTCVKDGPNDRYREAHLKIIHLLKQPTKCEKSLPELIKRLVEGNKLGRKLMFRLAQRTYGLLHEFTSWEEVQRQDTKSLGDALLRSGIVNIIDNEYSTKTPNDKLYQGVKDYKERWHGKLQECIPDLVICGGTFYAILKAWTGLKTETSSTGMEWFRDPDIKNCVYLNTPHPMARYPVAIVYTYLMVSAEEIINKCRNK
jgi:hypothetical protein